MKGFILLDRALLVFLVALLFPTAALCSTSYDALEEEVAQLKNEVEILKEQQRAPVNNSQDTSAQLDTKWTQASSVAHLSGYADAGFMAQQRQNAYFFMGHFNPIFHYLYKDLILAEGEVEIEIEGNGETEIKLEYGDLALFLNDFMTLIVGKFQSPLGFFFQNLHPTGIRP